MAVELIAEFRSDIKIGGLKLYNLTMLSVTWWSFKIKAKRRYACENYRM